MTKWTKYSYQTRVNCGIAFPTEKKLAEVLGLSISTKKDLKADDNGQMYNVSIQQYTRPTTKKTS